MNEKDQNLREKLEAYIAELDELVRRAEKSNFPFSNAILVYDDVKKSLQALLDEE